MKADYYYYLLFFFFFFGGAALTSRNRRRLGLDWGHAHQTVTTKSTCRSRNLQIGSSKERPHPSNHLKTWWSLLYTCWFSLASVARGIKRGLVHLELPLRTMCSVIHIERFLGRVWSNGEMKGSKKKGGWWTDCWNECHPPQHPPPPARIFIPMKSFPLYEAEPINALINYLIRLTG